eukprot:scaffold121915_cov23-Tisochrysis_lutea.AAC.1
MQGRTCIEHEIHAAVICKSANGETCFQGRHSRQAFAHKCLCLRVLKACSEGLFWDWDRQEVACFGRESTGKFRITRTWDDRAQTSTRRRLSDLNTDVCRHFQANWPDRAQQASNSTGREITGKVVVRKIATALQLVNQENN